MYYKQIHYMVRKTAAGSQVSIEELLESHGISRATYYRHLKTGSPWKLKDLKALAQITGKSTAEILEIL